MGFQFEQRHLLQIRDHPHLLGHLVGKKLLTELHSRWIRYCWYSLKHRAQQGHRGSYKTTAITAVGVVVWLLFHPSDRIAIIRKPYTEAAKILRMIRDWFGMAVIQELFRFAHGAYPTFTQRKQNSLIFSFKTTNTPEGSIDAYGVGGNITGNHYDKIICDDFITLKDRVSKAERESTKQFIYEILTNIIDPGKQCIFTGTPWHKSDGWTCVPKPIRYPINKTHLLTSEEIEEKRKRTTRSLFACNYLLQHEADENAIFTDPQYGRWDAKLPNIVGHLDAKYSGECYNALTFMAKRPDGMIQGMGWVFEEHMKEKILWIAEMCLKYRVKKMYNELNPDKGYAADLLKKRKVRVITYHESTNKHIKIVSYLKEYWDRIVWSFDTQPEYLEMITDYVEGQKPDDPPDSAASLLREAFFKKSDDMALWNL